MPAGGQALPIGPTSPHCYSLSVGSTRVGYVDCPGEKARPEPAMSIGGLLDKATSQGAGRGLTAVWPGWRSLALAAAAGFGPTVPAGRQRRMMS